MKTTCQLQRYLIKSNGGKTTLCGTNLKSVSSSYIITFIKALACVKGGQKQIENITNLCVVAWGVSSLTSGTSATVCYFSVAITCFRQLYTAYNFFFN